jgi:hypothetical protein
VTRRAERTRQIIAAAPAAAEPRPLPPRDRQHGDVRWTETRELLDADWEPLRDEKRREVHGYAIITQTPAEMLGRELRDRYSILRFGTQPFHVSIYAVRNGIRFGAIPRSTAHETRELALEHARRALALQGKRYARKYGAR